MYVGVYVHISEADVYTCPVMYTVCVLSGLERTHGSVRIQLSEEVLDGGSLGGPSLSD